MQVIKEILARCGLTAPDDRPIFAHDCTEAEMARLGRDLPFRVAAAQVLDSTAQGFVLWAGEYIRSHYRGGPLSWQFVFDGLGLEYRREMAIGLTERGLACWGRPLRRSEAGNRLFLYSLMAEGGLPDALLGEASRYRDALLGLVGDIEAEGMLGTRAAMMLAGRRMTLLPQVFHNDETQRLLADLAGGIAALRERLPDDLSGVAAERWLDRHVADWRAGLPLRLSPQTVETLIRPALAVERVLHHHEGASVRRALRRRADRRGWSATATIAAGALIPVELLPGVDPASRLRFLAGNGQALLGMPEDGGWRLQPGAGARGYELHLNPDEAVVLAAHADGRLLGEAVLDAGQPAPDEAPGLWRAANPEDMRPDILLALGGVGRTRGAKVWLLAGDGLEPQVDMGVVVGDPEPAPGGMLWPLSGSGVVAVGRARMRIDTGADSDADEVRLMAFGRLLAGWKPRRGIAVLIGDPDIRGAHGEAPLRGLNRGLSSHALPRLLGGQLIEWHDGEVVLARLRIVSLPGGLRLHLNEDGAGRLRLQAEGLEPGWHLALLSGAGEARGIVDVAGAVLLDLTVPEGRPGLVLLRLSDPARGAVLELEAPWPARVGLILDPDGVRLDRDRPVSVSELQGWRGILPSGGGTVQMRVGGVGTAVGFHSEGEIRLAALAPMLRQVLALAGPDARIHLRLIAGGDEGRRLEIGRNDWAPTLRGDLCELGPEPVHLHAVTLWGSPQMFETEAEGTVDMRAWLGDGSRVYLVQGHSTAQGVMRPFCWSAEPMSRSSRAQRIGLYKGEWQRMLAASGDSDWQRLWSLIGAAHAGGDAGALDQVQALGPVPAAAVALLLRVPRAELTEALALEESAPIWWPMIPCRAWQQGVAAGLAWQRARYATLYDNPAEIKAEAARFLARRAGQLLVLRPELAVHLGQAFLVAELPPLALGRDGNQLPLSIPKPQARLEDMAQAAARRFAALPDGAGHIAATHLRVGDGLTPALRPLLDAPLVLAETAAGLRQPPTPDQTLELYSLRQHDPTWFDAALPAALALALEIAR